MNVKKNSKVNIQNFLYKIYCTYQHPIITYITELKFLKRIYDYEIGVEKVGKI